MKARFLTCVFIVLSHYISNGQVSGTVFIDYNSNGIMENTASYKDNPYQGVTVTGYSANDTIYGPVTSGATGTYTLLRVNQPTRIAFSWSETWLQSSTEGGTSVQFVSGTSTNINFGHISPDEFLDNINQPDPSFLVYVKLSGNNT